MWRAFFIPLIPELIMPGTIANVPTYDNNIDALLSGFRWNTNLLSFSFTDSINDYGVGYQNRSSHSLSFEGLNAAQQAAARSWLLTSNSGFYAVSLLSFPQQTGSDDASATIRLAMSNNPPTAYAYGASSSEEGGDVWFNRISYYNPQIGSYAYHTFGHELGHALGLSHGHEGGLRGVTMNADRDSMEFSIMTYRSYVGGPVSGYSNEAGGFAQSLMMYDIAAIQSMYGAWFGANSGDSVYSFSRTTGEMFINNISQGAPLANRIFRTIWDGNGIDTYDFGNYTTNLSIDLAPGGWTNLDTSGGHFQQAYLGGGIYARGHVFNALQYRGDSRSLIENVVAGSGNDVIKGNLANNIIWAGSGNDNVDGGDGDDVVYLGDGDDTVDIVSSGNDIFHGGSGNDYISGWTGNETYYGEDGNDTLRGFSGNDSLFGGRGNDVLDGGSGIDLMIGGDGDDVFIVDDVGDVASEDSNSAIGGLDVVRASISYSLLSDFPGGRGYGIENLVLIGSTAINGDGNEMANTMQGNDASNVINGHSGADVISGGAGNDTLWGASANQFDDSGDRISGDLGDDLIGGSYGNDDVNGGDGSDYMYGDEGNDRIVGGNGNDFLYGDWGWGSDLAGSDSLDGGAGDDWLRGGAGNDILIGGTGTDTVSYDNASSSISLSLMSATVQATGGAGSDQVLSIENISGSSHGDVLTGNNLANRIYGLNGDDRLVGNAGEDTIYGGNGSDTLYGGDGNDWLRGDDGRDIIYGGNGNDNILSDGDGGFYYGEAGNDRMISGLGVEWMDGGVGIDYIDHSVISTDYEMNLQTGATGVSGEIFLNFENVSMGAGNDRVTGSSSSNVILGGNGNDWIDGGDGRDSLYGNGGDDILDGGLASDILIGGGGKDAFAFASALGSANVDTIIDFMLEEGDSIHLLGLRFLGLGQAGALSEGRFAFGAMATGADQRILYDESTGLLSYDRDGLGGSAGIAFAQLSVGLALTSNQFLVV